MNINPCNRAYKRHLEGGSPYFPFRFRHNATDNPNRNWNLCVSCVCSVLERAQNVTIVADRQFFFSGIGQSGRQPRRQSGEKINKTSRYRPWKTLCERCAFRSLWRLWSAVSPNNDYYCYYIVIRFVWDTNIIIIFQQPGE